jgi:hypothetical protein
VETTARLNALRELRLLDTPAEERFDRIVRLAKRLFDVPIVAINLIDEDDVFTKSAIGMPSGTHSSRQGGFSPLTVESGELLVVPDASLDPRFAGTSSVTGDAHVRFFAGAPLAAPGGEVVGVLCLVDHQPRQLSAGEHVVLEDLVGWVESELAVDADAVQVKEIQRRLLPKHSPTIPGYDVAGRCQPALNVGGDYYDWHLLDESLLQITLADVMGKGLSAAVIAAGIRTALRVSSRFNTLTEAVRRTAAGMQDDFDDSGTFATLFTARLRPSQGHLEYVDAGHGLAVIVSVQGETRHLGSRDLPLGADLDATWVSHEERLEPGDTLIVVSDGLLDVFPDPAEAVRAARSLAGSGLTSDEMADRILEASVGHPLEDDLTALVVRREE